MRVGVRDAESGDGRGVRLDLRALLEGQFPDLDGSRVGDVALLADAAEKDLARVVDHKLADVVAQLGQLGLWVGILVELAGDGLEIGRLRVDDLLVTDGDEVVVAAGQVDYGGELDLAAIILVVTVPLTDILRRVEVVEVDIAILTASREAHIVGIPVNAHDSAHMALELHIVRAVTRVKVVHMDVLLIENASEQVTSIREPNLITTLNGYLPVKLDLAAQDVAHEYFVLQGHDQVQTTRVEGDGEALFRVALRRLVGFGGVVPDADGAVTRAGRDKLFAHADVKTRDLGSVKRSKDIVKLLLVISRIKLVVVEVDFGANQLTVVRDRVDLIIVLIRRDR